MGGRRPGKHRGESGVFSKTLRSAPRGARRRRARRRTAAAHAGRRGTAFRRANANPGVRGIPPLVRFDPTLSRGGKTSEFCRRPSRRRMRPEPDSSLILIHERKISNDSQLRTVDHSARRSMKNAANCAKHGELQGFMKPLHVERILRPWLTGQGHARLRVDETPSLSEPISNRLAEGGFGEGSAFSVPRGSVSGARLSAGSAPERLRTPPRRRNAGL